MDRNPDSHSTRRIVLPSGRSIEVVSFTLDRAPQSGLHVCPACSSQLVQAVAWSEAANSLWELTLHCPNCDWLSEGVFDGDQVEAFEEQLDDGVADMLNDLRRLTQANMAQDIDRFTLALQTDLILPEDF